MELIKQPTSTTCGQACIAMIAGKSVEQVMKDMKTDSPTSIGQLMEILDFYGIRHAERNKRISKKNPVPYEYSILTVHTNAGYTHWTLLYDGKYYDPEFGLIKGEYTFGKITSFLEIYGIRKVLINFSVPTSRIKQSELNGQCLIRCDQEWFNEVELQVNQYLAANKSRIIEDIFGTPISAQEIKVALEGSETAYFVSSVSWHRNRDDGEQKTSISVDIRQYENGQNIKSFESQIPNCDSVEDAIKEALQSVWRIIVSEKTTLDSGQLFLPVSHSGLQLLYKHYFIGVTEGNLVLPMKDFLHFLQIYTDYELAPFIKALSSVQRIEWLYCDEVENSLHPLISLTPSS